MGSQVMSVLRPLSSVIHPHWVAIPNFVDTDVFRPVKGPSEKKQCRKRLEIPEDSFVVGTAAAVKKDHKRIDYLINEFASFLASEGGRRRTEDGGRKTGREEPSTINHQPYLLVAGSQQKDTDELVALAQNLSGDRIKVLTDIPREDMPDLYRCMDVFVLTSLFEMMPIAVLEALASGLPVIANDHPVLRWMIGGGEKDEGGNHRKAEGGNLRPESEGESGKKKVQDSGLIPHPSSDPSSLPCGAVIDMSTDGDLAEFLSGLTPEWLAEHGAAARLRAENVFATDVVIGEYVEYYKRVISDREG